MVNCLLFFQIPVYRYISFNAPVASSHCISDTPRYPSKKLLDVLTPFREPSALCTETSSKRSRAGTALQVPEVLTEDVFVGLIRRWATMAHDPMLIVEEVRKVDKELRRKKPTGDLVVVDVSALGRDRDLDRGAFAQLFASSKRPEEYAMANYVFARLELLSEGGEEATVSLDPLGEETCVVNVGNVYYVQEAAMESFTDCYWNPLKGLYGLVSELVEEETLSALRRGGTDMRVVMDASKVYHTIPQTGAERRDWGNGEVRRLTRLQNYQQVVHTETKVKTLAEVREDLLVPCIERGYSASIQWSALTPPCTVPINSVNTAIAQMYNFVEKIPVRADMELRHVITSLQTYKKVTVLSSSEINLSRSMTQL